MLVKKVFGASELGLLNVNARIDADGASSTRSGRVSKILSTDKSYLSFLCPDKMHPQGLLSCPWKEATGIHSRTLGEHQVACWHLAGSRPAVGNSNIKRT